MKAIGGYFELELSKYKPYHVQAMGLNTARNSLEYILRVKKYNRIFIPYFTCEVLLEPLDKLGVKYEFYQIDENLEPIFDYDSLKSADSFLYTNYFGIKDEFTKKISKRISNLIIDNSQSFFSLPIKNVDTFYSARKFVGVGDGGYLYCDAKLDMKLEEDTSHSRMSHLLIRSDLEAEEGFSDFIANDNSLKEQSIRKMSKLTQKILSSLDYTQIKSSRMQNFNYLHSCLKKNNLLKIDKPDNQVPQTYPFWTKNKDLKSRLLDNRIFCATYWPNVLDWCEPESIEYQLASEIVHLPIDQRYDIDSMKIIKNIVC